MRLEALSRQEMYRRVLDKAMSKIGKTPEEALTQLFESKRERIQTALRVNSIQFRDRNSALAGLEQIKAGKSLVELAKTRMPAHSTGKNGNKPWELGVLEWHRIPPEWEDVLYSLSPGQTSDVVDGQRVGVRIFQVVERLPRPNLTLEEVRGALEFRIRDQRIKQARDELMSQMRRDAKIERIAPKFSAKEN